MSYYTKQELKFIKEVQKMWEEIDPCHVCPSKDNPTDEYESTAGITLDELKEGKSYHQAIIDTLKNIYGDDEQEILDDIDVESVERKLREIYSANFN